jgi:NitT/TauT family transport system ATP-binding protein
VDLGPGVSLERGAKGVNATSIAVSFDKVSCSFGGTGKSAPVYHAVRDVTLEIGEGEFVSVVGPTGCGKSTVLNMAAGLMRPSSGRIAVFGEPLTRLNRKAGYLFQADSLLPWYTALQNVLLGLEFQSLGRKEATERATDWLSRVGLSAHGHRYPHQMSGGMRKRVALAQMLVLNPQIMLMDEPFSALDVQTRILMENELLELWSANRKSVIFVTHDLEEAISLSDRVVVLSAGPASHPIAQFKIDLPRPRDIAEIRLNPRFLEIHREIWETLKTEVLKGYAQTKYL